MNVALISAYFDPRSAGEPHASIVRLVRAMCAVGHAVTVLATTEPVDAHAAFASGESALESATLIRFRPDLFDPALVADIEAALAQPGDAATEFAVKLGEVDLNRLIANRLNSTMLLTYLARRAEDFASIVFFGETTGVTLRGWKIAAGRTAIVPRFDAIANASLSPTDTMMTRVKRIIVETPAQEEFARHVFGPGVFGHLNMVGTLDDDGACARFLEAIGSIAAPRSHRERSDLPEIVHVLQKASYANSTTLLAMQLDELLRNAGYRSAVVAFERDARLGDAVRDADDTLYAFPTKIAYSENDVFSGTGTTEAKIVFADVPTLEYADGRRTPIPPFVDVDAWGVEPPREMLAPLAGGSTNLLGVGDVVEESGAIELVEIFRHYVMLDFAARLFLVGPTPDEAYLARLKRYIARCGLEDRVQVTGTISRPGLAAMYRSARVFVSVRERFRTGLSLLEAMTFDVPLCVPDGPSARAITSGRTILFSGLQSAVEIAALWRLLVTDQTLRNRVVASQRAHLDTLGPDRTRRALEDALGFSADLVRA